MKESEDSSAASTIGTSPECSLGSSTECSIISPQCSPISSIASSPSSSPTVLPKSSPIKQQPLTDNRPPRPTLAHPSTAVMVTTAIKSLKDRKGSTLPAIKKYLAINYQVDSAKFAPYIRRYLKSAVAKGELIQSNGTGATGNFKLPTAEKKPVVKQKAIDTAVSKKKQQLTKKTTAKAAPTATSGKRRSLESTTTTAAKVGLKAKKPKKIVTAAVVKPKTKKTADVAAKAISPAKTKKSAAAASKNNVKVVAKKGPTKNTVSKKK